MAQRRGPLLAVVGETVVAGKLPIRIERIPPRDQERNLAAEALIKSTATWRCATSTTLKTPST